MCMDRNSRNGEIIHIMIHFNFRPSDTCYFCVGFCVMCLFFMQTVVYIYAINIFEFRFYCASFFC